MCMCVFSVHTYAWLIGLVQVTELASLTNYKLVVVDCGDGELCPEQDGSDICTGLCY